GRRGADPGGAPEAAHRPARARAPQAGRRGRRPPRAARPGAAARAAALGARHPIAPGPMPGTEATSARVPGAAGGEQILDVDRALGSLAPLVLAEDAVREIRWQRRLVLSQARQGRRRRAGGPPLLGLLELALPPKLRDGAVAESRRRLDAFRRAHDRAEL